MFERTSWKFQPNLFRYRHFARRNNKSSCNTSRKNTPRTVMLKSCCFFERWHCSSHLCTLKVITRSKQCYGFLLLLGGRNNFLHFCKSCFSKKFLQSFTKNIFETSGEPFSPLMTVATLGLVLLFLKREKTFPAVGTL